MTLLDEILQARGLTGEAKAKFLHPKYEDAHDPFLLPDMSKAVERLCLAYAHQEHLMIYGDYDIDGLTATTVLLDAFRSFGFEYVDAYIPNRFVEGYGLTVDAVERIAKTNATLIVTVDCGSLSEVEIRRAAELGMDVIVTDHHNVAPIQPPAVAVINPKRLLADHPESYKDFILQEEGRSNVAHNFYPFLDLAGVGVAFKLVQALQTKLDGLPIGQEKWLLDLVALGTVCDVVTLRDENRANVYWGLKVLSKTRRPGLRALMAVASVEPNTVSARSLGFALGPRMNAAGRLETAQHALDMLRAETLDDALAKATYLDELNVARRTEQNKIFEEALKQAEVYKDDPVLVVSAPGWNHGIIGIVAAKLLERFHKPTYVLEEMGDESKGSARSFGDFSAADAIRAADDLITKGGGHKLAAGVTLPTAHIPAFRKRVNDYYKLQHFSNQAELLLPRAEVTADLGSVTEDFVTELGLLEPFGNGNPQPVIRAEEVMVISQRTMGADGQHVKLELQDSKNVRMHMLAFNAPSHFFVEPGQYVHVWFHPDINEWQGRRSVEGKLLHLQTL